MHRIAFVGLLIGLMALAAGCRFLKPGSPTASASAHTVMLWSGAVTDTSARVHARVPGAPDTVRLHVHPIHTPADTQRIAGVRSPLFDDVIHFQLLNLQPATAYRYTLPRADTTRTGRFRTFASGPQSFRVAMGACAATGSRHPVFDAIRVSNPDLFLHMGDMHYEDISTPSVDRFRQAYHQVHASPEQAALFRSVPLAYVWDDHDYGPNNSSRRAPGQDAAQHVYREYVPHYALAAEGERAPIYQSFTVGRVRFLLTDLRSARTPNDATNVPHRTMMGAQQKQWFKNQLMAARDQYPLIVWVSSVPWIANDSDALDRWSGFPEERRELATFIDSIGVNDQLVMLSGDAHMVAFDDGTHNHYGRPDGGGFPIAHAAALDRRGSTKGGPYTHGPYPNRFSLLGANDGQFVLMDVKDEGGPTICVTWTGKRQRYDTDALTTLFRAERCFPTADSSAAHGPN